MDKTKSVIRIAILHILVLVTIMGIAAEPQEPNWFVKFFASKALGFAAGYCVYYLGKIWKNDQLIKKLFQNHN